MDKIIPHYLCGVVYNNKKIIGVEYLQNFGGYLLLYEDKTWEVIGHFAFSEIEKQAGLDFTKETAALIFDAVDEVMELNKQEAYLVGPVFQKARSILGKDYKRNKNKTAELSKKQN